MAADDAGNYAIWGAGGRSCNQFEKSAEDSVARGAFKDYLMGYLTAYNALAPGTYNALGEMTLESALAWLDGYCDEHRMDSFDRAITQLVIGRHEQRQRGAGGGASGGWGRNATEAPAAAVQ
ncbi:MAG: hypothetical protein AB7Q81_17075 [Gammaproteobacteria bacterium]